ncbi:hypothetical protein D6850_07170 [Roseovarius spongiae]|uniref:DUF4399 domain-containing protein n=1 Tax=Roseovarius spongiae TaxID=2320272 RepID=A0A3A8AUH4_9RHOB|nr:hypothetical protein [Roseovarius spongiae]RKF14657.1 hypothetical protein D6850_07170 [Roseovarius spongiae]
MPKRFVFLLIGLFFGAGFGFLLGASPGADRAGHDHGAHDHGGGDHMGHGALVEAGTPAPTLTLHVLPDGAQSRNLHLVTTDFTFAPERVNGPHVPGEGHAHVYVNGVKQPRVYAPYVHLDALARGTHDIRVTLNANDHRLLAVDGAPIMAETRITIP